MQDKELQDALVGFVIGGVLTGIFALIVPSLAWPWYVLAFLVLGGAAIQGLRRNRLESKVAYDKGVAVKPATDGANFCTQCGEPTRPGASFCPKCGAEL